MYVCLDTKVPLRYLCAPLNLVTFRSLGYTGTPLGLFYLHQIFMAYGAIPTAIDHWGSDHQHWTNIKEGKICAPKSWQSVKLKRNRQREMEGRRMGGGKAMKVIGHILIKFQQHNILFLMCVCVRTFIQVRINTENSQPQTTLQ